MNIAHLDKGDGLAALYNNAKPQGLGCFFHTAQCMTKKEAQQMLREGQTYFDYVKGRVMKIDLSTDELETDLYNRDNGKGAAEKVIEMMEKQSK